MPFIMPEKVEKLSAYEPENSDGMILRLDANESCFDLTDQQKEDLAKMLMETDFRRYPDPMATELCEKAASIFGVQPSQIASGCGSDELISIIVNAFGSEDRPVIVSEPDISMYSFYSEINHLKVVPTQKDNSTVDVDALIKAANDSNASIVIFSNPCNPTGTGVRKEEVLRLIESVSALVIVDEAYMDFWDQSILDSVSAFDHALVLKTCSKAVGFAAMRVGFAVGCDRLTEAIRKVKSPYNLNTLSQKFASYILSDKKELRKRTEYIIENARNLEKKLIELQNLYPDFFQVQKSCANFNFLKTTFSERIWNGLKNRGILVRRFQNGLRITTGSEQENEMLLKAFEQVLEGLK